MASRALVFIFLLSLSASACALVGRESADRGRVSTSPVGPPTVIVSERPRLVFAAGYGVYFAPDLEFDLYFDHGTWYYLYEGGWYKSANFRGPWTVIRDKDLPSGLKRVSPGQLREMFREREAADKEKVRRKPDP